MKDSILRKLDGLAERYEELEALLADSEVIEDQERFRRYSQEFAEIEPVVGCYQRYRRTWAQLEEAREMLRDGDEEIRALARDEQQRLSEEIEALEPELQKMLLPRDERDGCDVFLEIRAGTGGDEAALFAGDLFRMYARYCESMNWQDEVLNERPGEQSGYREIVARISGRQVYARLKFESGAHRVQRVPETETQGRIHTSACTVAVLPVMEEQEEITIDKSDLRVDTFRASGAGGQHINKTDSAIRITHIPSGIVVECQDQRSQHKNRARAMAFLQARLNDRARREAEQEISDTRRRLVGSGDRSERIRTYNFPQGRVTDHRINLTLYKLNEVLAGGLEAVIEPLIHEYQADLLAELAA